MRYYNGRPVELLAPAGNFEIFNGIIDSKCDAFYFGGSILNMRLIRKGYNFSNEELKEAIQMAHAKNKLVYITVNNLISNFELDLAKDFLLFLETCKPDGLIVQDLAILNLIRELKLTLPLHASVMMNVHNLPMIEQLETLGYTRVVLSREMDLETMKSLHQQTTMEFEYFTHGDMCIAHGAQCLYSGILFGMSSNRGRCLKPCRWSYNVTSNNNCYEPGFPLAVKDLCMYEHLPAMLDAGVSSFKLEGRMRNLDVILKQINLYGEALDLAISSKDYDLTEGKNYLFENRKRDLSTGYAFGTPGLSNINTRYEGTGALYSTGKMFSTPTEEPEITPKRLEIITKALEKEVVSSDIVTKKPKLSVRVQNTLAAKTAIESGADIVYLTGDNYLPNEPFTKESIEELHALKGQAKIILALPRMMNNSQFDHFDCLLSKQPQVDGLLITNLGALNHYRHLNLPMYGDYSLNIYNSLAITEYKKLGLQSYTISPEAPLSDYISLLKNNLLPTEVIIHGRQVVMYLEHNLYNIPGSFTPTATSSDTHYQLSLVTEKGKLAVHIDQHHRNHILSAKELYLLPILSQLRSVGVDIIRIEDNYSNQQLAHIIAAYRNGIDSNITTELVPLHGGFTLGALQHN